MTETMTAIKTSVREAFEESALSALEQYTAIECVSPVFDPSWREHGNLDQAAKLLFDWCIDQHVVGAHVEVIEIEERTPLIYAEILANDPARAHSTTLIYGHFDKQPALGPWREGLAAFTAVREGDRLYGRGTADDGYAIFAAFSAIAALDRVGLSHGRIVVIIEGSEESGSTDLDAYIEHLARRIGDVGLVVCLDSGCATYDRLWLTGSLRGLVNAELRVDVLDEGVHSGHAGGIVPSSFRIARELLSRIEDERTGEILLPELHVTVPEYRRNEIVAIASEFDEEVAGEFPTVPGLRRSSEEVDEQILAGTWEPALEIIGADGLPPIDNAGNVLRPYSTLKLSVRIPPTCDPARAAQALEEVLTAAPPSGALVDFRVEQEAPGWNAPPLSDWLERAIDEASTAFFGSSPRSLGIGGSIPFMAALSERFPDAQFLATGVLGPQANAHGPNEFLHIPTAEAVACSVADVLSVAP